MSRKQELKKRLIFTGLILGAAVLALAIVTAISYIPRRTHGLISGVEILFTGSDEFEIVETHDILIDGWVRNGLFSSSPRFRGYIEVSGYHFTNGNRVIVDFLSFFSQGFLLYSHMVDRKGTSSIEHDFLGVLHTNQLFSPIAIQLFESEAEAETLGSIGNRVIVAPATDMDSARRAVNISNLGWSEESGAVVHFNFAVRGR